MNPLDSILELGKSAIDKIWPDPIKRAEEMRKLQELYQQGDIAVLNAHVKLMMGQLEVNKAEANSSSMFVAGWRPFIGWAGGFALAYAGVIYPLLTWVWATLQAFEIVPKEFMPPPLIEVGILGTIVTGMLGLGSMRTFEKTKSVQRDSL